MTSPYAQQGFRVGFDWGPAGAAAVPGSLVAVVDVLNFPYDALTRQLLL